MKKTILLLICVLAFTFANAQDETDVFKQSSGDKNLELQFDPGAIFNSSNTNNVFSNGVGIRFRLFQSESIAYRLQANISYTNFTTITQDADNNANLLELKDKNSSIDINLSPGIEKHFAGTKRLSPYIGGALNIGYQSSTEQSDYQAGNVVYVGKTKNGDPGDGFSFGLVGLAGADFYIAKKVYLGLELNYGVYYIMPSKTVTSDSAPGSVDVETKVGKPAGFIVSPSAMGVFRIGFLFSSKSAIN